MNALVFLAPGFEEIEAITVIDILRRAEIETTVAGLTTNPITASRGTRHLADIHIDDVDPTRTFDVIVLPGGAEGAKNLAAHVTVQDWLLRQLRRSSLIAALCAAPTALPKEVLDQAPKLICHPTVQKQFPTQQVSASARVVTSNKLITGIAAGASLEFSYEIVRQLFDETVVEKVNRGVCAAHV
jgi:DJ-1 family protein